MNYTKYLNQLFIVLYIVWMDVSVCVFVDETRATGSELQGGPAWMDGFVLRCCSAALIATFLCHLLSKCVLQLTSRGKLWSGRASFETYSNFKNKTLFLKSKFTLFCMRRRSSITQTATASCLNHWLLKHSNCSPRK